MVKEYEEELARITAVPLPENKALPLKSPYGNAPKSAQKKASNAQVGVKKTRGRPRKQPAPVLANA